MPVAVVPTQRPLSREDWAIAAPLTWLLVGPLARECAQWGEAPQTVLLHLQAVQPKAALFTLDLPGTGRLWREASPDRIPELVANLRQRVAAAGLKGPFGLVATGWASAVAAEWARQHGEELGAVVLLNPGMRPFTQVIRSIGPGLWAAALAKVLGRRAGATPREYPFRARNGVRQLRAIWHFETTKRRPHTVVLLLAGKVDGWLDWRISAAISRAWGAALRLHPEAGHDLLLDDPQWVGRSIAEWLLPIGTGGTGGTGAGRAASAD